MTNGNRRNGRGSVRIRRDRRGRGMRGPLVPAGLPLARTRAEQFDDRVLQAVEHLERRWARELEGVEFAVEDVPQIGRPERGYEESDVVEDGAVPLARVIRERTVNGTRTAPRIVLYRRPLEARALDPVDLDDIVHDIVVEQVSTLLGVPPEELDPPE
ncbi:MAG TPA: metallopeptidase family protein [Mycobacteriales bacterium]|nr:metallopeptidase family protein [Mycobacteriales bacterium]